MLARSPSADRRIERQRWLGTLFGARQALGKKWLGTWTNDAWSVDDPLLVEQIRRRILPRRGIMANDDEILVTLGAQNALYLLTTLLHRLGIETVGQAFELVTGKL